MRELKQDLRRLADSYGEPGFTLEQVRGRPPARRPRSRRVKVLAAVAVAAALAIALPILLPLGPGGPDPAVAGLLRRFARIAAHAPAEPAPGPGQFVYTKIDEWGSYRFSSSDGTSFVYSTPAVQERWLGPDGSGRILTTSGDVSFATPQDEAAYRAWVASGGPASDGKAWDFDGHAAAADGRYGPGQLFYRDTSALPTDPATLRELIEQRQIVGGPPGDSETFVLATDLIRDSYARPELRAALYEVMAELPGIELVGRTTDGAGRRGVALASTHDGIRNEVVFDPKTARILEEREIVLSSDGGGPVMTPPDTGGAGSGSSTAFASPGHALYRTTYLVSAVVVDSDSEVPAA